MPLTTSEKASILAYKKQIISYQLELSRIKEKKKLRTAYFAHAIKTASSPSTKAAYRTNKLNEMNNLANQVEAKKKQIAGLRERIAQIKK